MQRRRHGGWSLLEVMMAVAIVTVGLMVMLQQLGIGYRESELGSKATFAFQKAAALLTELQNACSLGGVRNANELYQLADAAPNPVLTTRRDGERLEVEPDHPMSGNSRRQGQWQWARRIELQPHEQPGLYYATVHVQHRDGGQWHTLASQAQLLSLLPDADAPLQEFDVWLLACGESPSLLGDLAQLRTQIERAAVALQTSARLRFRLHWITQLGYGRDPCYAPFVNATTANAAAAQWAYWLPGQVGSGLDQPLYAAGLLRGVHRTEQGLQAGAAQPFAIADRNNHCLQAPAAQQLFAQLVAQGAASDDEPPLQLLLDRMLAEPERFRGAMFVNLHGSGLPLPPLRNYADAARAPDAHPGVRVVTHPARLWTQRDPNGDGDAADSQPLELRVYAWHQAAGSGGGAVPALAPPITLQFPGACDLAAEVNGGPASTLQIRRLPGGVDPATGSVSSGNRTYYGFDTPQGVPPTAPGQAAEMWYETGFVGGAQPYTWIRLHNTPLSAPAVGNRGLAADARLYGCDYIPSPVTAGAGFGIDLATPSTTAHQPRNTARWRIRLLPALLQPGRLGNQDRVLQVVTRIGTDLGTGVRWPVAVQPGNRSDAFAWWTRQAAAVPPSQRLQLLGDPRHLPYADLMRDGALLANGYNWHFDDLRALLQDAQALWPCFDAARLQDGFGSGCRADAPRGLQLWRQALQACGGTLVSPGGAAASYLLLGGDVTAAGGNGQSRGVQLPAVYRQALLPTPVDTCRDELVLGSNADAAWWAKPWLGELYPDSAWASWYGNGNLALGSSGSSCRWRPLAGAPGLPFGTSFGLGSPALGPGGSTMLLDCGSASATFRCDWLLLPTGSQPQAGLQAIAGSCGASAPVPPAWSTLQTAAPVPAGTEAYQFTDSYPRGSASLRDPLLATGSLKACAAVIDFAREPQQRGFLVPLGAGSDGAAAGELLGTALLAGLRAQHVAGLPTLPGRLRQLPQLAIVEPAANFTAYDPVSVLLRWQLQFVRYDGQPYTDAHDPGFAESEGELVYRLLVSRDAGNSWSSVLTGAEAQPGAFPDPGDRLSDAGTGNESFVLATPAESWPGGEYRLRVECHDLLRRSHCSSHQLRIVIRRN